MRHIIIIFHLHNIKTQVFHSAYIPPCACIPLLFFSLSLHVDTMLCNRTDILCFYFALTFLHDTVWWNCYGKTTYAFMTSSIDVIGPWLGSSHVYQCIEKCIITLMTHQYFQLPTMPTEEFRGVRHSPSCLVFQQLRVVVLNVNILNLIASL